MLKRSTPDLPSKQTFQARFELRSMTETRNDEDGTDALVVEGHASVFGDEYEVYGGPPYGWIERVAKGAFTKTLSEDPDVVFLLNHEGMPLARSKSGTLDIEADKVGLAVRAELDPVNPVVVGLRSALDRGDIDEMSFAFRTVKETLTHHPDLENEDWDLRIIDEANINRGDVSAVTFGASPTTDIDIVRSLDQLSLEELAEARAAIDRRLKQPSSDGTSGEGRGGMPPHLLEMLRIQPNPALKEYTPR